MNYPTISIDEQLFAFADDERWRETVSKHGLPSTAFRIPGQMDFIRSQFISFLKSHPKYIDQYISIAPQISTMHDVAILEHRKNYHVFWVDRGKKIREQEFPNIFEALNAFFVGFIPEPDEDKKIAQDETTRIMRANTIDEW